MLCSTLSVFPPPTPEPPSNSRFCDTAGDLVQQSAKNIDCPTAAVSVPLMSVAVPNNASSESSIQAPSDEAASHFQSFYSSPSSAPMSAQASQKTIATSTNTTTTPASSTFGAASITFVSSDAGDGDGDVDMNMDNREDKTFKCSDTHQNQSMDIDEPIDLNTNVGKGQTDASADVGEESYGGGMRGVKRGLECLQDNEDFFDSLLCSKPHRTTSPYWAGDVLATFGLGSLVSTVARMDPKTGEKINRMRKSYEGHIKALGLSGKNKAVNSLKNEDDAGPLLETLQWPDEEWQVQKVGNQDVRAGWSEATKAKLMRATDLERRRIPNGEHWESILGLEKAKATQVVQDTASRKQQLNIPSTNLKPMQQPSSVPASNAPSPADASRTRRRGRKRRYDEGSFEGYGEGFEDDEETTGDDGSRRGSASKKKRKKEYEPPSQTGMNHRAGGYGIGMVVYSS